MGDKNTTFFHRQCRARLSRNHISKIYSSEGEVIKGHTQLQQVAKIHFQHLFQEDDISDEEVNAHFLSNIPTLVSSEINVGLEKPFSEKEIVDVIRAMELDKAPGPDGFSIHLYKVCWPIINSDLLCMVSAFQKKKKKKKWVGVTSLHSSPLSQKKSILLPSIGFIPFLCVMLLIIY